MMIKLIVKKIFVFFFLSFSDSFQIIRVYRTDRRKVCDDKAKILSNIDSFMILDLLLNLISKVNVEFNLKNTNKK